MSFSFYCPHCSKGIKAEEQWSGQTADCPSCGNQIVILSPMPSSDQQTKLIQCEDCGKTISRNAEMCPKCGARNKLAVTPASYIRYHLWKQALILSASGICIVIVNGFFMHFSLLSLLGFIMFFSGVVISTFRKLKCNKCGYDGTPLVKGTNIVALLILFCLGILPGILYILLCPTKYYCKNCGEQALG